MTAFGAVAWETDSGWYRRIHFVLVRMSKLCLLREVLVIEHMLWLTRLPSKSCALAPDWRSGFCSECQGPDLRRTCTFGARCFTGFQTQKKTSEDVFFLFGGAGGI